MKTEISAGGVIVRRKGRGYQVLLILDMGGNWTFPKGKIEQGESDRDAAIREISEEVGLTGVRILAPLAPVRYTYKRNGTVDKTVYFFLCLYEGSEVPAPQQSEGITKAKWVSLARCQRMIGYPESNRPVLKEAMTKI